MITIAAKIDQATNLVDLCRALNALGLTLHYMGRGAYTAIPASTPIVTLTGGAADPTPTHPERHGNINRARMIHHHRQIVGATPAGPPSE